MSLATDTGNQHLRLIQFVEMRTSMKKILVSTPLIKWMLMPDMTTRTITFTLSNSRIISEGKERFIENPSHMILT